MVNEKEPKVFAKYKLKPNLVGIGGYKFQYKGSKLEIDKRKKGLLDETIRAVANKHDSVMVYTGYEGTGKSSDVFIDAAYIANECDMEFSLKNIHFLPEDVEKAVTTSPIGTVHVWDEAILGVDSLDTSGKVSKVLRKVFTVCRKRRQFVFLVLPNIWMLNKYFATVRSRFMVHHISADGVRRGDFAVYGRRNKSVLYNYGKKTYSYHGKNGKYPLDFEGRFIDPFNIDITGVPLIDEMEYDKKKQFALENFNKEEEKKESKLETRYKKRAYMAIKHFKKTLTYKEMSSIFEEKERAIKSFFLNYKEQEAKDNAQT